jgi:predicted glycosyltransferase
VKVFFYGHSVGLGAGHFVRSLRLAESASEQGWEVKALWPGSQLESLNRSHIPLLKMPALESARPDLSLLGARSEKLARFVEEWEPDVVVVDLLPFGFGGELVEALLAETATIFVWGLPYAERQVNRIKNPRLRKALKRYAAATVYTDPGTQSPVSAYDDFGLPAVVEHVGVVTESLHSWAVDSPPVVACLVGSGGLPGSGDLCRRLLEALPRQVKVRFVVGPLGTVEELPSDDRLEVLHESSLSQALEGVSAVVSRAGYNTSYALMTGCVPVVLVPTSWPEQFARAQALEALPGVVNLDEDRFGEVWAHLQECEVPKRDLPFRIDGASNTVEFLRSLAVGVAT